MKPTQTIRELLARIRQCLDEAGVETSEEAREHEVLVAGRLEAAEGEPIQVVVHISDEDQPAIKFGSVVARSVAVPSADIVRRPSLEGRSAAGASRASDPGRALEGDDVPRQIEKLGDLRESGVLTSEEFKAAKKRLLDRI
jgi:hypothetical protein